MYNDRFLLDVLHAGPLGNVQPYTGPIAKYLGKHVVVIWAPICKATYNLTMIFSPEERGSRRM